MKYIKFGIIIITMLTASGCFQVHNDDCTYHTIPTTNNPNIVPNHSSISSS